VIASLTGVITAKSPGSVVIDVGGVGYEVAMPGSSIVELGPMGERVTVLTHLNVREDEMSLFGFRTAADKQLFRLVITVSGVGPKVALGLLSAMTPAALADAVAREDVTAICEAPGIGKKLAQRLVMELKDKLDLPEFAGGGMAGGAARSSGPAAVQTRDALLGMGFTSAEAAAAIAGAPDGASVEETITFALRRIGAGR
jgi:Holliday junction DNA helicase RuvA